MNTSTSTFSQEELERYSRQLVLPELGREGQEKLKKARVLLIGAGGLGCPSLLYLAAAGVGTIGIADGDNVALSNLHRQVLFNREDVGRNKALTAAKKLSLINPFVLPEAHPFFLEPSNAERLVDRYDLVIDGSDNFSTRYLVNDACVLKGKPFIYAALHKFELQLAVFNLGDGPTYRCLYPHPPAEGEMPSCAEAGVIGVLPGLAGTLQAVEAIKIITGNGQPLAGKLLIMDLLSHDRQLLNLSSLPENRALKSIRGMNIPCETRGLPGMELPGRRMGLPEMGLTGTELTEMGLTGTELTEMGLTGTELPGMGLPGMELTGQAKAIPEIDMEQLRKWLAAGTVQLIDVRSPAEFTAFRLNKGEINLPLDRLEAALPANLVQPADRGTPVVLLCLSGQRSQTAGHRLKARNAHWQIFSLRNGISGIK